MYRSSLQPKFSTKFYNAKSFETKDHADEVKGMNLSIFDISDNSTNSSTFFSGNNYLLCREECRTLVNGIKDFVHEHADQLKPRLSGHQRNELNRQLTTLENHLCDDEDYFLSHKEIIYGEGKASLAEFLILLKKSNISLDKRMNILINAAPTMGLCSGGLMTALQEAVSSLRYSTGGVRAAAQRMKTQMMEHLITEHIKSENHTYRNGDEIHLVNAYFNKFAEELGTPQRKDEFTSIFQNSITPQLLKKCTAKLKHELRPDSLSTAIAHSYLDLIASDQKDDLSKPISNANITNVINNINQSTRKLESEFGEPPPLSSLLQATSETYQNFKFIKQPTLISKHFIEKLNDAKLIDNCREINLSEDDDGVEVVKQLGNLFWRQCKANECKDISSEALISLSPVKIIRSLENQNISMADQACILIEILSNEYKDYYPIFSFENQEPWFSSLSKLLKSSSQTECATALHLAAAVGSKTGIEHLTSVGVNINSRDADFNTPLIVAAQNNKLDAIQELLNHKCDASLQNNAGDTALMVAAGNPLGAASVKMLLAYSEPRKSTNRKGENAYTRAASEGSLESVRLLLNIEPYIDIKTPYNLQSSSKNLQPDNDTLTRNINQLDHAYQSMLHCAAKNGRAEIIELLIWAGADVNQLDYHNEKPLMKAIANNKLNAIRPLILAGAEFKNEMSFAFSRDNAGALKGIHEAGINIHTTDKYGKTILMLSAEHRKIKFLEYLLLNAESAYVNASCTGDDNEACTALSLATKVMDTEAISLLIMAGAESGQLVIHVAAQGATQALEQLIAAGATLTARDPKGMTALMLAAQNGELESIKCLCEVLKPDEINAKFHVAQGPHDITALNFAAEAKHTDVVNWLISKGATDTRPSRP